VPQGVNQFTAFCYKKRQKSALFVAFSPIIHGCCCTVTGARDGLFRILSHKQCLSGNTLASLIRPASALLLI